MCHLMNTSVKSRSQQNADSLMQVKKGYLKKDEYLDNIIHCLFKDRVLGKPLPNGRFPTRIHYAFRLFKKEGIPAIKVLTQSTARTT